MHGSSLLVNYKVLVIITLFLRINEKNEICFSGNLSYNPGSTSMALFTYIVGFTRCLMESQRINLHLTENLRMHSSLIRKESNKKRRIELFSN